MDTTKDVYEDGEVPEFQLQVVNGVEKKVPWADVPVEQRYLSQLDDTPGSTRVYKYRVPIVKITIDATDKSGRPANPEDAYNCATVREGLNPKHTEYSDRFGAH